MLKLHELLLFRASPAGGGFRVFSAIPRRFQKKHSSHVIPREITVFGEFHEKSHFSSPGPPENTNSALLFVAQINAPRQGTRKGPKPPKSTNPDQIPPKFR